MEQNRREFLQKIMVEQNRIEEKRVLIEDNGRVEQNRREEKRVLIEDNGRAELGRDGQLLW